MMMVFRYEDGVFWGGGGVLVNKVVLYPGL